MKGNFADFLKLAAKTPELTQEILDLAARYGFEFSDEVNDEALDSVAGGVTVSVSASDVAPKTEGGTVIAFPGVCWTPVIGVPVPMPYPNTGTTTDGDSTSTKGVTETKG